MPAFALRSKWIVIESRHSIDTDKEPRMTWKKLAVTGIPALALVLVASGIARAGSQNLVTNGSFEVTTNGGGQLGFNTNATGWTTTGYNFLFTPGSADTTGVAGQDGNLQLWGPGNGSNNGLTTSPDGGNFVAADGAFQVGAIDQTINGLTVGDKYAVSFYWAGAQQHGFTSPTTEQWVVGLGSDSQSTSVIHNPNHGFTGWYQDTMVFQANSTSEVLSFLAVGTPSGVPPFSLLDGVYMTSVPEPSSLVLMGVSLLGLGGVYLRQRLKK
jgi:hypothetical protein